MNLLHDFSKLLLNSDDFNFCLYFSLVYNQDKYRASGNVKNIK